MKKKMLTEKKFLEGIEKLKRRPALRERLRPQVTFTDRKKEEAKRRCRKKPNPGTGEA